MANSGERQGPQGRAATRIALIEAAESLFARPGIDAVTSRELQEAAGSANKNVVAYYFADRAALVAGIYEHREPAMEARRAELLAHLDIAGEGQEVTRLLDALYRPYLEQTDANGRHSYCRFLAALHSGWGFTRREVRGVLHVTNVILGRLRQSVAKATDEQFERRISMTFAVVAQALQVGDEKRGEDIPRVSQLYFDAIRAGGAVFATPFGTQP
jgi:AcrR family transcriptional regulator